MLCARQETRNAGDMQAVGGELVVAVVDAHVTGGADIDQAGVAKSAVGLYYSVQTESLANQITQNDFLYINDDLSEDLALAFEHTDEIRSVARAALFFFQHLLSSDVRVIDFHFLPEVTLDFVVLGYAITGIEIDVDRAGRERSGINSGLPTFIGPAATVVYWPLIFLSLL